MPKRSLPAGPPAFLLSRPVSQIPPRDTEAEARARKLARLELLATSLVSAAADCPPSDPGSRSRIMAAATAASQLVAHLRRQEPVSAQIERLTAERRAALEAMRTAGSDMDAFREACKSEAELAARIRQLREVNGNG